MSASSSSAPLASKIPPELGELLAELGQALLDFGNEHDVFTSNLAPRCGRRRRRIADPSGASRPASLSHSPGAGNADLPAESRSLGSPRAVD